jgi:uncharacterized protein YebE (UPF0316 family)
VIYVFDVYSLFILPMFIFGARVLDVSLQTMRVIFVSKGLKYAAPLIGFFEVLIWILAIMQIMRNTTNSILYIAYAGGFALGTFVGIQLEQKLSIGMVGIRVITRRDATKLIKLLRSEHVGVTVVDAEGPDGPVKIIYSVINRHDLERVISDIKQFNPHAFYDIEDVRFATKGIFPLQEPWYHKLSPHSLRILRKGK